MGEIKKVGTLRKTERVDVGSGEKITDITPVDVFVSGPKGDAPTKLTQEDVWGKWHDKSHIKLSDGMIVARCDKECPIFGDIVPYKSVTVVFEEEQMEEVTYWLEFVYGAECVEKTKPLKDGKIAIRASYMCW